MTLSLVEQAKKKERGRLRRKKKLNRDYYRAHAEQLKAKRRARYRAQVLGLRKPSRDAIPTAAE